MLACEAAMSRSSFAERFARVVGMTPLNYLLQWRLSVAKHLLAHEQKSVGETALAVGYESASGFSTAFSREIGLSPKEFIRTHRTATLELPGRDPLESPLMSQVQEELASRTCVGIGCLSAAQK